MPLSAPALWSRICAFRLDESGVDLPFSARLARDNGWTRPFAERVIVEYLKFAYLACARPEEATPSGAVDEAWHLHLAYTRSYWDDFCENVLRKKLHHGPTKGGSGEAKRYREAYLRTLQAYEAEFGAPPPEDIWPPAKVRFSRPLYVRKIDTFENWVIPKPSLLREGRRGALVSLAALLFLPGCTVFGMDMGDVLFWGSLFGLVGGLIYAHHGGGPRKKGGSFGCSACGGGPDGGGHDGGGHGCGGGDGCGSGCGGH